MKNYKSPLFILAVISMLFVFYNIFTVIEIYKNKGADLFLKICVIFASIGVCAMFFNQFIIKSKQDNDFTVLVSKIFPILLILINVVCLSVLHYILLNDGFGEDKEFYWQILSIILSLGIVLYLILMIRNYRKFNR